MARMPLQSLLGCVALICLSTMGCQTANHTQEGMLTGGLLGAGTGAIIGGMTGHPGAGAAIGAGLGTIGGAAVGNGMDEVEAKNRQMIAQQLGRQVNANAVSVDEVIAMAKGGVSEELIVNHVRAHGVATTLQASDLIRLQQEGVSTPVIAAMQATPPRPAQTVVVREAVPPPAIIVEEYPHPHHWGPPRCYVYH